MNASGICLDDLPQFPVVYTGVADGNTGCIGDQNIAGVISAGDNPVAFLCQRLYVFLKFCALRGGDFALRPVRNRIRQTACHKKITKKVANLGMWFSKLTNRINSQLLIRFPDLFFVHRRVESRRAHASLHHVSCSPSKIPYVGFSPVRLQTGIQLRPSLKKKQGLSARPTCTMYNPTYTQLKLQPLAPMALPGMSSGAR